MKKLLLALAVVGVTLFTACNKDQNCGHEFVEYDYSEALIGTWTCLEEDQSEAMVINPDGSFAITGVMKGGALYEENGTIKVVNNKVTLAYNSGDVFEGRLELVAGKSLSIVLNEEYDIRLTYDYCENDLSDEIVGTWVCNDGHSTIENDMAIITYSEDGKMTMTAPNSAFIPDDFVNQVCDYKVVGDLLFKMFPKENFTEGGSPYLVSRVVCFPNGTSLGDVLIENQYTPTENGVMELTFSFLRVKQSLDLKGQVYDYNAAYVTNAKGIDEDFSMLGYTFNMADIKANNFDMMYRTELFCIELNGNSMKQRFRANGEYVETDFPITVEGNKVALDMSAANPAFRKVEMYMFQDKDNTQLHMYMHTNAFINYFANLEIVTMMVEGKIDPTDTAAVEKVFTDMEARVESINVSLVFKVRK